MHFRCFESMRRGLHLFSGRWVYEYRCAFALSPNVRWGFLESNGETHLAETALEYEVGSAARPADLALVLQFEAYKEVHTSELSGYAHCD